ncbi:ABC transporter ATP-binding protein [Lentilactobacillus sp. Marseille-Q4993]|uniref:ABC transporter ATP-binding protein n=1 Tax=Lentilactobacillus sp. Marseille-Q4993 TaxID=3039492 RepID=UPI0024BD49C0|nr:ABC transporter ATP-binding protein [Lentilactobacillus sp. Marseille-Q4993]
MKLTNVDYSYQAGKPFIANATAEIQVGKITSIIGPNGAGKSTLLKLLTGQIKPTAGKVEINDTPIDELTARQRAQKIAVVAQQNMVYDDLTVSEAVKTGRIPYHSTLSVIDDEEIDPFLEITSLTKYRDKSVGSLSGGQQQRVWLAAAIAQEPDYLFLDEPTTYLDIRYQKRLMTFIKQLNRTEKLTVILVLHDINQAFKISDNILMMAAGKIVAVGPKNQLMTRNKLMDLYQTKITQVEVPDFGKYFIEIPD